MKNTHANALLTAHGGAIGAARTVSITDYIVAKTWLNHAGAPPSDFLNSVVETIGLARSKGDKHALDWVKFNEQVDLTEAATMVLTTMDLATKQGLNLDEVKTKFGLTGEVFNQKCNDTKAKYDVELMLNHYANPTEVVAPPVLRARRFTPKLRLKP